jgi:hypothetical protein
VQRVKRKEWRPEAVVAVWQFSYLAFIAGALGQILSIAKKKSLLEIIGVISPA